ncbi:MerR family transcriptional regulator [bacterium]|nr:MerR family transcriptional regulator [bacterium]MDD6811500.1 MerR family transcriptional regulator [Lachnospiraceae bacterium]MDY3020617.1 MerR family transcriptional regulator [Oliverpabstia sp.]
MKINEVEQLVGIKKKNIRFYEDQGLLHPERNKTNGYREYSDKDVDLLMRIKLLRKLAIPIEEIRNILEGKLTLAECLNRHQIYLNHERKNLERIQEVCEEMAGESVSFEEVGTDLYLNQLDELERGGNRFMNVENVDVSKKKRGAVIAAVVMITLIILWDVLFLVLNLWDPMPTLILLLMIVPPTIVIIGVLLALRERMKEIDKGEDDEAVNY